MMLRAALNLLGTSMTCLKEELSRQMGEYGLDEQEQSLEAPPGNRGEGAAGAAYDMVQVQAGSYGRHS